MIVFRRRAAQVSMVVASLAAALGACSNESPPSTEDAPAPVPLTTTSPFTYKFFLDDHVHAPRKLEAVPLEVARAAMKKAGGTTGLSLGTNSAALALQSTPALIHAETNGMPVAQAGDNLMLDGYSGIVSPLFLATTAAMACGMVYDPKNVISTDDTLSGDPTLQDVVTQERNHQRITAEAPLNIFGMIFPWVHLGNSPTPYYLFPKAPATCDEMLEDEETLVCIADKLAQLADTVGPLRWFAGLPLDSAEIYSDGAVDPTFKKTPVYWVMPPPAETEKFIVRDMALAVLGQVAQLDAYPFPLPGTTTPTTTCSSLYAMYDKTHNAALEPTLFGAALSTSTSTPPPPLYPPMPLATSGQTITEERQSFQTNVLRAAGQLVHDLVRESVYADLAGAAAQTAAAADPRGGQRVGYGIDGSSPYNSLAHAARTLFGRLEVDMEDPDPACADVEELALLPSLADVGTRARALDVGAVSSNEATAETLFEASGLVLQDGVTDGLASILTTQLVGAKATSLGRSPAQFATEPGGLALAQLVASLSAADLARGAQHNRTTFAILTETPTADATTFAAAIAKAGLAVDTSIPNTDLGNKGIVVKGGLPSVLATTDPMARVGDMMGAASCAPYGGWAAMQLDESAVTRPRETCPGGTCETMDAPFPGIYSRQNVFDLGHALRSRLVKLREQADGSAVAGSSSTLGAQARAAAIAELGAWAGAGRVVVSTSSGDNPAVPNAGSTLYVDLVGVSPSDFGVKSLADLNTKNTISVVVGDAKTAECAAHLTPTPCGALGNAVLAPIAIAPGTFGALQPTPDVLRARYGITDGVVRLSYPLAGTPLADTARQTIYIVAAQDPSKPTGVGEVLAAVQLPAQVTVTGGALRTTWGEASTALAPMRRELVYDAFGLGRWVGAAPPHAGELPVSGTPTFCIEGVERDIFVPLQNDLTSSSDNYENSWQRSLAAAQTAAQRADDIGQTLVDIGYQNDVNIENAAVQLQSISGAPTNVDNLSIDSNGKISAGPLNGPLNSVLTQPIFDVVFFSADPTGNLVKGTPDCPKGEDNGHVVGGDVRVKLMTALGCAKSSTPLCNRIGDSGTTVRAVYSGCASKYTAAPDSTILTYTALDMASTTPPQNKASCTPFVSDAAAMRGLTVVAQSTDAATPGSGLSTPVFDSATRFQDSTLADGLQKWTGDKETVEALLNGVRMAVSDDGGWQVSLNGAPIMSTASGSAWPGCLQPDWVANHGGCDWTNPLIDSLNDIFRACPTNGNLRSSLGACDGPGSDPTFEINSLRWRVEGALWLAGMMAGAIPSGMVRSPMPAANNPTANVPLSTYFVNGAFSFADSTSTSPAHFSNGAPGTENDVLDKEGAHKVAADSPWYKWSASALQQLPPWLRAAYTPSSSPYGSPLVNVNGVSLGGTSDFSLTLAPFFSNRMTGSGVTDTIGKFEWLAIARWLAGRQCPTPLGPPVGVSWNTQQFGRTGWLQGLVTAMKTSHKATSEMEGPLADLAAVEEKMYGWNEDHASFEELTSPSEVHGPPRFFSDPPLQWNQYTDDGSLGTIKWFDTVPPDWAQTAPSDYDSWRNVSQGFGPDMRVRFALNSQAPASDCDAAWQFTQAIALSCVLDQDAVRNLTGIGTYPTSLNSIDDLTALSFWLKSSLRDASAALQNAYVERIPTVVVANAVASPDALTHVGGTAATSIVQASNALLDVYAQWNLILRDADGIASGIEEARIAVALAEDANDATHLDDAIRQLQTVKAMADDVARIFKATSNLIMTLGAGAGSDLPEIGAAAVALSSDSATVPLLDQLDQVADKTKADRIRQALYSLHDQSVASATAISNALIAMRQDANNVTAGVASFASARSEASYYAGKALGANVWQCAGLDGQPVECLSHVNTVLNRRYAGQKIRYEAALKEAKALGYIARRAIEQRIGIRLSDIATRIGPLEAPATWADDVCHLTGINYKALRTQLDLDAGAAAISAADQTIAGQFADAFIGDYVQKLTDFVQYYNLAYPEADGSDQAVLSVRESLLGGKPSCLAPSPNLLTDSSRLFAARSDTGKVVSGWTQTPCDAADATCLVVRSTTGTPPSDAPIGGISWLADIARAPSSSGSSSDAPDAGASSALPDNAVTQTVRLDVPGNYVLSWWDQARDADGHPSASQTPYRAAVYDSAWNAVAGFTGAPAPSDASGSSWSARHALAFKVGTPDVFHVVFAASTAGGAPGSVAIADPQLELVRANGEPSAYVDTGGGGSVTSFGCALSPADLRARFQRACDPDGTCYYDLQTPIVIETQTLTSNGASLAGKIAAGNYNYRHVDVALNMVGTGVLDCSQSGSPDCQGAAYLTYTLTDDGTGVGVLGYDGQYRRFDFGTGAITQGKALAAERYVTSPIGSADQQLLAPFLKTELRGRPLDGTYRLRIYDSPALHFDQLQDIQIILNYRYWSRVIAPQHAN